MGTVRSASLSIDVINVADSNTHTQAQGDLQSLRLGLVDAAIERYSENLAKLLLLGHYSALQAQAQDVFDLSHSLLEFKGARLQQGYTLLSISLHNMWVYLEKAKTVFEDSLAESTGL